MKHGYTNGGKITREYRCWLALRNRCNNPNSPHYKRYGARGIRVCDRWNDFSQFLADMGPRPPGTSIDRIDNDGNYEPGNCRWATQAQQARNTSRNVVIGGKVAMDWSASLGSKRGLVESRIRRGWPKDKAISVPMTSRLTEIDKERARDLFSCGGLTYQAISNHLGISVGSVWRFTEDLREQQSVP